MSWRALAYRIVRPLLFRFEPERIHRLTIKLLRIVGGNGIGRGVAGWGGGARQPRAGGGGPPRGGGAGGGRASPGAAPGPPPPGGATPPPRLFPPPADEALINR